MAVARDDLHLHVGTSADSKGLDDAADHLDKTTKSSDKLGDSFKETGDESGYLDRRTKELHEQITKLGREIDRTGDKDLFKELRKSRSELSDLKRIQRELPPLVPSIITGSGIGGPGGVAALASIAAPAIGALAVMIGGVVSGAVSGLTVGGGMLGGILSATRDGRVRAAASDFGDTISKEFFSGGAVFADPVVDSLKILQDDFASMNLGTAFAKAAPDVETLAHGIGDMGKNLMPGFNRVMDRSGEYTGILAGGLADTGEALSDMLITLVESKGAADGLRGAFVGLTAAIEDGGDLLGGLSDGFHFFATGAAYATGALEDFLPVQILSGGMQDDWNDRWEKTAQVGEYASTAMHKFNAKAAEQRRAFDAAEESMRGYAGSTTFAVGEVIKLTSAMETMRRGFLAWKGAEVDAEQAVDDLAQSFKDNGTTLDVHTQKGRDNVRALQAIARASAEAAQAKYNETGSLAQAQKVYDSYRDQLIKTLVQAGKTRAEAEKLATAWLGIPGHVATVIETTYVTRKISADEYKEELRAGARHQKRAMGGPVMPGVPYTINERAMETVTFPSAGMVHPATLTPAAAGAPARVVIDITGGDEDFKKWFRKWVRVDGGGNVQTAVAAA